MPTNESRMIFCQHDSTEFKRVFARATLVLAYIAEYNSHADVADFTEGCIARNARSCQRAECALPDGDIRAIVMSESA